MNELVGLTINFWTIIEARPNGLKSRVKAKCICGKEKILTGRSIKDGSSKSCGCKKSLYRTGKLKIPGTKPATNKVYSYYRTKARNNNLEFTLSIDQFTDIINKNCFYCNKQPKNKLKTTTDCCIYNGIDRVDNNKGYTIENSKPCCGECNTKKSSIDKEMIFKLYEFFTKNT